MSIKSRSVVYHGRFTNRISIWSIREDEGTGKWTGYNCKISSSGIAWESNVGILSPYKFSVNKRGIDVCKEFKPRLLNSGEITRNERKIIGAGLKRVRNAAEWEGRDAFKYRDGWKNGEAREFRYGASFQSSRILSSEDTKISENKIRRARRHAIQHSDGGSLRRPRNERGKFRAVYRG